MPTPAKVRLAIVSTAVPPGTSGQAKMLGRIACGHDDLNLILISDNDTTFPYAASLGQEPGFGSYFKLTRGEGLLVPKKLPRGLAGMNFALGLRAALARRARDIEAILRSHNADLVMACSGNPFDLTGSSIAARKLGKPLVAYLFDDPIYQWPKGEYRQLAKRLEPQWSRRAHAVICPNPRLARDYLCRGKWRRAPAIIPNPILRNEPLEQADRTWPIKTSAGPIRLVYTGSVYDAQADALINVAKAATEVPDKFQLHIYSPQTLAEIASQGLNLPGVVLHAHVDEFEAARVQRDADILILPLAFRSFIHETILSSSPGKMGEYLFADRPILVHAPVTSYLAEFFAETGAGLVIGENDPVAVLQGLSALTEDFALGQRLVEAARMARQAFTREAARAAFLKVIAEALAHS